MIVLLFVISFLFGSMPSGLLVARGLGITDPRASGSGNIGAANMVRVGGKKAGAITFFLDFIKGLIPVALATIYFESEQWVAPLVGMLAILGHCYSIFLRGHGGKGVATSAGVFLILTPVPLLMAALAWLLSFWASKITSLAVVFALVILLLTQIFMGLEAYSLTISALCCLVIIRRHESNLTRLLSGEEASFKTQR